MFDQKIMLGLMQIFTGRVTTLRSFDINWTKLNTSGFDPYVIMMSWLYRGNGRSKVGKYNRGNIRSGTIY